jgi:hypothetical protein
MNNEETKKRSSPDFSSLVGTAGPVVRWEAELPPVISARRPYLIFFVCFVALLFNFSG